MASRFREAVDPDTQNRLDEQEIFNALEILWRADPSHVVTTADVVTVADLPGDRAKAALSRLLAAGKLEVGFWGIQRKSTTPLAAFDKWSKKRGKSTCHKRK